MCVIPPGINLDQNMMSFQGRTSFQSSTLCLLRCTNMLFRCDWGGYRDLCGKWRDVLWRLVEVWWSYVHWFSFYITCDRTFGLVLVRVKEAGVAKGEKRERFWNVLRSTRFHNIRTEEIIQYPLKVRLNYSWKACSELLFFLLFERLSLLQSFWQISSDDTFCCTLKMCVCVCGCVRACVWSWGWCGGWGC